MYYIFSNQNNVQLKYNIVTTSKDPKHERKSVFNIQSRVESCVSNSKKQTSDKQMDTSKGASKSKPRDHRSNKIVKQFLLLTCIFLSSTTIHGIGAFYNFLLLRYFYFLCHIMRPIIYFVFDKVFRDAMIKLLRGPFRKQE